MGENKEHLLKVGDFEQLLGAIATFETTLAASCCQMNIGMAETTMFNKWATGKSDLFTSSIHLDENAEVPPSGKVTLFIPNVKKLLLVLKNVGKYYDIKDATLFTSGKVKLFVCANSSYIRVASPKYSIKFQLSTNAVMESQLGKVERVDTPSKYGEVVHRTPNPEDLQSNFLLTANINANKFSEVNDLLTTLSETSEASIKIQIPEQAKIETDVNPNPLPNTLYATISDNQKLVRSNIGNKVSVEFGKITYAAENYLDICNVSSITENSVFLCNKDILDTLSATTRSFVATSKAKDIEIVISKPNLIHLNMSVMSSTSKSEIYVTVIGIRASTMF